MKDNYTDHFTVCWGPGLSTDSVGDKTLSYAIELLLMCTIMIFFELCNLAAVVLPGWHGLSVWKNTVTLCLAGGQDCPEKLYASWQQWTCQGGILWGSRIANSVGFFDKITELCN